MHMPGLSEFCRDRILPRRAGPNAGWWRSRTDRGWLLARFAGRGTPPNNPWREGSLLPASPSAGATVMYLAFSSLACAAVGRLACVGSTRRSPLPAFQPRVAVTLVTTATSWSGWRCGTTTWMLPGHAMGGYGRMWSDCARHFGTGDRVSRLGQTGRDARRRAVQDRPGALHLGLAPSRGDRRRQTSERGADER